MLFLEVVERLETDDELANLVRLEPSRARAATAAQAAAQVGDDCTRPRGAARRPVALRVAHGVGGPTAWVITKSRAGVGATVGGVRQNGYGNVKRPRSRVTVCHHETPVEDARMQQVAPPAVGITGTSRRGLPRRRTTRRGRGAPSSLWMAPRGTNGSSASRRRRRGAKCRGGGWPRCLSRQTTICASTCSACT